jgi:hypothetical protein
MPGCSLGCPARRGAEMKVEMKVASLNRSSVADGATV